MSLQTSRLLRISILLESRAQLGQCPTSFHSLRCWSCAAELPATSNEIGVALVVWMGDYCSNNDRSSKRYVDVSFRPFFLYGGYDGYTDYAVGDGVRDMADNQGL